VSDENKRKRHGRSQFRKWYKKQQMHYTSSAEIAKRIGCHPSTVKRWFSIFRAEEESKENKKSKVSSSRKALEEEYGDSDFKEEAASELISAENAFLRWWNQGERLGYVDKLLKEIQKD
jgi:transposase